MSMADDYRNEYSKEDDNYYVNHIKRNSTMQVSGEITIVQPRFDNNTNAQRSWQAHGKTNFVYDMTVTGPTGPVSGEISSRKEGQYPRNVGDQITVNVTTNEYGNKFSAVQEQQGYQQQAPQQQGQAPQQAPQQQNQQRPPQNDVQDNIRFAQALNLAVSEFVGCKTEEIQIKERARIYYHILKSRAFPASMSNEQPQPQAPSQQAAPPQQEYQQIPFEPNQDIPF